MLEVNGTLSLVIGGHHNYKPMTENCIDTDSAVLELQGSSDFRTHDQTTSIPLWLKTNFRNTFHFQIGVSVLMDSRKGKTNFELRTRIQCSSCVILEI